MMSNGINDIVIASGNHLLFKAFPLRILVNDKDLYVLKNKSLVNIKTTGGQTKINISNGYHLLPVINITHIPNEPVGYKIETYLDNIRIGHLIFITLLLFLAAWTTHSTIMQIVANLPILIVCAYVLINKKNILYLQPLDYTPQSCRG